jgi:dTDP-4-dehydrorhamnose 3,5-epimerase
MIFTPISIHGACVIDLERRTDSRGYFARAWCHREFEKQGLATQLAQVNISRTERKGTVRGMHYQVTPHQEAKVVCCVQGAVYDVVLDLRRDSPTWLKWAAMKLTADDRSMLYVPNGCAHGFQTLTDETDVLYFMSEFYSPDHARGVRFDDPAFGIEWPLAVADISDADRAWPDFAPA